ncbi:hypothetical protein FRB94_007695 [Tulasnella sp. JGI-2019a]|nr:hypothetical protein FRB94_007695 [Tulasnella sp. JGI-2019a]
MNSRHSTRVLSLYSNYLYPFALQLIPDALMDRFLLDEDVVQLLGLLGKHGNPKEVLMAADESLEMIIQAFDETEDEDSRTHTAAVKLKIIIDIYGDGLPRLPLGKKFTPEDTIFLTEGLHVIVSASSAHIGAFLGLTTWAECFPNLIIPSRKVNTEEGGQPGRVLGQEALSISTLLGGTGESRLQLTRSKNAHDAIASLVFLAHDSVVASSASIPSLIVSFPAVLMALTKGRATDEAMSWILRCLRPSTGTIISETALPEEIVLPLTSILVSIASLHPSAPIRQMTLSILTLVVARANSDTIRLQLLDELCNECPYPQMRVAAIGLAKKSILEALQSEQTSSLLASPEVLPMVLKILTPNPPDLFTSPSTTPEMFLESHEPGRLVEALGLFYVLNQRDTSNRTRIRDVETRRSVHTTLLFPLKEFLSRMQVDETSGELVGPQMGLFALEMALDRVEVVVVSEQHL